LARTQKLGADYLAARLAVQGESADDCRSIDFQILPNRPQSRQFLENNG
jgi:hypothetical protein